MHTITFLTPNGTLYTVPAHHVLATMFFELTEQHCSIACDGVYIPGDKLAAYEAGEYRPLSNVVVN